MTGGPSSAPSYSTGTAVTDFLNDAQHLVIALSSVKQLMLQKARQHRTGEKMILPIASIVLDMRGYDSDSLYFLADRRMVVSR